MPDAHEVNSALEDVKKRLGELSASLDLEGKRARLAEVESAMEKPDFWDDQTKAQAMVQEMKGLKDVVGPMEELLGGVGDAEELLEMGREEEDQETIDEVSAQIMAFPDQLAGLETMALLSGPHDRENCYFSIHTGAGGSDACEWAEMLLRMYTRYFERKGWKVEELSLVAGDEAGIKGVDLRIEGNYAYGYLRGEMGVHRLVRISPFSGRRETSFAAIDVVPDFDETPEVEILDKDIEVDTFRAGGKGGQHVNKTDSAVRVKHVPSGIVVSVQNERSQHANKAAALKILASRLQAKIEAERMAEADKHNATKSENAWGSQIRNYVLNPYTMVKDVRTGQETGNIQGVLDGDLDPFLDAYLRWALAESSEA